MEFKEQIKTDFIPRLRYMILMQENHLVYLHGSKGTIPPDFKETLDNMITENGKMLKHLHLRLKEYIEYSKK